jgi:signal transduction histidine kinase
MTELRQRTEQILADVHDLSVTLRPAVLDDVGLMAALERHCRTFSQRMGVTAACLDKGLDGERLPPEVELTIYRMAQEALTNAIRHGHATEVTVEIERQRSTVRAVVRDNGGGFDAHDWRKRCVAGNHLGLRGIEERVTLLGGVLRIKSALKQGATLSAEIPVRPEVAA